MSSRFVKPETVRLDLSGGDWIEIKAALTNLEQRRMTTAGLRQETTLTGMTTGQVNIDWVAAQMARQEAYLVEWSFRGEDDKPVAVSRVTIGALDPDTSAEIDAALDAYITARELVKKAPTGTTIPEAKSTL